MLELFLCALLLAMFLSGAPLFAVILGFALLGDIWSPRPFWEDLSLNVVDVVSLGNSPKSETLVPIPLFIFAGYILAESRTADRLLTAARTGLGWMPWGLSWVTIAACALFTTFTGASGVTIVALGGLLLPSLLKDGYPDRFATGLVAGTGSVGLLFPPAVPLFVFATVYGWSYQGVLEQNPEALPLEMDRFILAGVVPGVVLCAIIGLFCAYVAIKYKVPSHKFEGRKFARAMAASLPELALPFLVIYVLIAGNVGIPEVSAFAVLYVLFIEMVVYRDIKPRDLIKITRESMALTGAIFIIIIAATALANTFVNVDLPTKIVHLFTDNISTENWWLFLLAVNVILLLAGMLMDIFSAILIIVPLLALPADSYGIDPYHLGVVFLLNLEIGYITPPVGLNLFITSLKFRKPMVDVTRATLPFLTCMVVALVLVTYLPALTVVPPAKRRGTVSGLHQIVKDGKSTLGAVAEIRLPDGTMKALSSCKAEDADKPIKSCENLFLDVTECRKKTPADLAKRCEDEAIAGYLDTAGGSSGSDLLTPSGDDDEGDPTDLDSIGNDGDDAPADDGPDDLDSILDGADGDSAKPPTDDGDDAPDDLDAILNSADP